MSKTVLILVLILLLAGGGAAFAEYSPAGLFASAGGTDENEENNIEGRSETADAVLVTLGGGLEPGDGDAFGQAVSTAAKEGGLGEKVSAAARSAGNEKDYSEEDIDNSSAIETSEEENGEDEEERSAVATAVLETLGQGAMPGDDSFGEAVSSAAKEGGLGSSVSEAARSAAGSNGRR